MGAIIERQCHAVGPGRKRPGDANGVRRGLQDGRKGVAQHSQMIANGP